MKYQKYRANPERERQYILKPKTVQEQFQILRKYFDILQEFKIKREFVCEELPKDFEANFVGFEFSLLSERYDEAMEIIFTALQEQGRSFRNEIKDKMSPKHLRFGVQVESMVEMISQEQNESPVFVYPAQMGKRYAGHTPASIKRRMRGSRFGLSSFLVAIILLTHEELLKSPKELFICCVGDEFSPNANYNFDSFPIFFVDDDGTLIFDYINGGTNWNQTTSSATGYFKPYNW